MSASHRLHFAARYALRHLLLSLLVALASAAVVFGLWYPAPYRQMLQVGHIYLLVLVVDVVCGPLLTLIVASPRKSRRERWLDFSLIGAIQLAALACGMYSVWVARPAVLAFVGKWGQITISDFIRHMGADLPAIKRSWRSVVLSRASPLVLRCLRLFAKKTCLSGAAQRSGHKGFGGEHGARRSSAWAASRFHNSRTTMVDAGS